MNEYIAMWKNYVNFKDRTTVKGYWMAFLINFAVSLILGVIANFTGITMLASLYSLAVLLPSLGMTVRRLNDAGKPWPWIFIAFVPVIGAIWLIVLLCKPSAATEGAIV